MREQVELLEYHTDFLADLGQGFRITALWRKIVAIHLQMTGFKLFQTIDAADQGGLTGATGADNDHHFALFDG